MNGEKESFLSGFSTNELELVMAGKFESFEVVEEEIQVMNDLTGEIEITVEQRTERVVLTPRQQLEVKLSNHRYDIIEEAARRGLEKECA